MNECLEADFCMLVGARTSVCMQNERNGLCVCVCVCESECICYFDCIFMLSVPAMNIRICGVHLLHMLVHFHTHKKHPYIIYACVSCRVLWPTDWVRGVTKALLYRPCGGSCPGSGI